jgi:hypothetical protein
MRLAYKSCHLRKTLEGSGVERIYDKPNIPTYAEEPLGLFQCTFNVTTTLSS